MRNPHDEPPLEPHPTHYVLRVKNGRGSITPPLQRARGAPMLRIDRARRPEVHHTAPPATRGEGSYGVWVYEKYPGQTVIEARGEDGFTVLELSIQSQLVQLPHDAERVRDMLAARRPLRRLSSL